jgi:hypothetical protein
MEEIRQQEALLRAKATKFWKKTSLSRIATYYVEAFM